MAKNRSLYTAFGRYAVRYDLSAHELTIHYTGRGTVLTMRIDEARYQDEYQFCPRDYKSVSGSVSGQMDAQLITIAYEDGPDCQQELGLLIRVSRMGVDVRLNVRGHFDVRMSGALNFGEAAFPMCLDYAGSTLRSAYGPAASAIDNALFDRETDSALLLTGVPGLRIRYDWEAPGYGYAMRTGGDDVVRGFHVRVLERVYQDRFGIPYAPINKKNTFPSPPVGWMTWYAVQFDASERTVLENARFLSEHLAQYGANTIWVDWEWYHRDFSGTHREGVNVFHPDDARYPSGLGHVADEIRALGLIPALWIGATNDPGENEFIKAHPDAVLVQKRSWCGQYFLDPTHPLVNAEYIPHVFRSIVEMGYSALKWDCLPITFEHIDANHDRMKDSSLSTDDAMRSMVQFARDAVGPDFYMLSCSGSTMRDITFAADLFDAARIGGDIFHWKEFISQGIGRVRKLYALHNVVLYADPDNVVIRPKYNNFHQAVSRVNLVAALGLPFTMGDNLPDLPQDLLYLIRHSIPALDIHPMDVRENPEDPRRLVVNLAIDRPFERWNVAVVMNLLPERQTVRISLDNDLQLDTRDGEKYLLFDFWNRKYLGEASSGFTIELQDCESRAICLRKKLGRPQLLSTTRHLSQGAVELSNVRYDEERMVLSGTSEVVGGDDYALYLYAPKNLRPFYEGNDTTIGHTERVDTMDELRFEAQCPDGSVWRVPLAQTQDAKIDWAVAFTSCHPE